MSKKDPIIRLVPLDTRPLQFPPKRELTPEQQEQVRIIMERARWNLYRGDAVGLLYILAARIDKRGGERQRTEGMSLIRRIQKRLREWVS